MPAKKAHPVFADYAKHYDLFYRDKNYTLESAYVLRLIRRHNGGRLSQTILDLGCGTGGHAIRWASKGIVVTGIDRSEEMLSSARRKCRDLPVTFLAQDLRSFRAPERYDAVTAMFAVMSYLTAPAELQAAFRRIRRHLEPGGLFLFDAWHGPGVLHDPPGERVKIFKAGHVEIIRTVRPVHFPARQRVDVHYDILLVRGNRIARRIREIHPMHYFFREEVRMLAQRAGFRLLSAHPYLKPDQRLGNSDWNAMFVLKAV